MTSMHFADILTTNQLYPKNLFLFEVCNKMREPIQTVASFMKIIGRIRIFIAKLLEALKAWFSKKFFSAAEVQTVLDQLMVTMQPELKELYQEVRAHKLTAEELKYCISAAILDRDNESNKTKFVEGDNTYQLLGILEDVLSDTIDVDNFDQLTDTDLTKRFKNHLVSLQAKTPNLFQPENLSSALNFIKVKAVKTELTFNNPLNLENFSYSDMQPPKPITEKKSILTTEDPLAAMNEKISAIPKPKTTPYTDINVTINSEVDAIYARMPQKKTPIDVSEDHYKTAPVPPSRFVADQTKINQENKKTPEKKPTLNTADSIAAMYKKIAADLGIDTESFSAQMAAAKESDPIIQPKSESNARTTKVDKINALLEPAFPTMIELKPEVAEIELQPPRARL